MTLSDWIHDDITWCIRNNCPMVTCRRNPVNMINRSGLHSYAVFMGTSECPISCSLDICMDGCIYAKECFAKHEDPDDALRELTDVYCDKCVFSSTEED